MGVIYKLHPEVIQFIVNQKQTTPALGCRDLAKIVSQSFEIPVSKSSVNAVLLDHNLSSPVGRRGLGGKKHEKKKFEIPHERRQQLFSGMGLKQELEKQPAVEQVATAKPALNFSQEKRPNSLKGSLIPRADQSDEKVYINAGAFFLWAILREMGDSAPLVKFILDQVKGVSPDDLKKILSTWVISKAMGQETFLTESSPPQQALTFLYDLDQIKNILKNVKELKEIRWGENDALKIGMEIPSALTQISYIRICLEGDREIILDPYLNLRNKDSVHTGQLVFLEKVLDLVNTQIINNVQSAVIPVAPTESLMGSEDFSDDFLAFLSSFEDLPGKRMKKIVLYDDKDQELVTFDTIPQKRRYFMAGIYPQQVKFLELKAKIQSSGQGTHPQKVSVFGQIAYVIEGKFQFSEQEQWPPITGRVVFLSSSPTQAENVAIITNAPIEVLSLAQMISSFANRWPSFSKFLNPKLSLVSDISKNALKKEKINKTSDINYSFQDIYDINHLVESFSLFLINIFKQRYLPVFDQTEKTTEQLNVLFGISAQIIVSKELVKVTFLFPVGKPFLYTSFFEQVVFILNQSNLRDKTGRNFWFTFA